jgi:hypothetical protein
VADGGEDDVGGIADAAFEITAAEMTFGLEVSDDGLDGRATAQLALDDTEDAALFWSEMKTRPGFCASWRRYPLST